MSFFLTRLSFALHLLLILLTCTTVLSSADTWVVIASSSRFWLNYRHTSNALGVYEAVKRLGVPDSHIILMLADDSGTDPRNSRPGTVLATPSGPNWHLPADIELDYRGREAGVSSLLQVLTGRHPPGTPPSQQLRSGPNSSVLVYLTGHGGDGFLKFHDQDELLAADVSGAVAHMHAAGRYGRLLLMLDTCQAATMYAGIAAPNWIGIASSTLGQSSYALNSDSGIGVHLVDEFSYHLVRFLEGVPPGASPPPSIADLVAYVRKQRMSSEIDVEERGWREGGGLGAVRVMDFFGSRAEGGGAADRNHRTSRLLRWAQQQGGLSVRKQDGGEGSCEGREVHDSSLRDTVLGAWPSPSQ